MFQFRKNRQIKEQINAYLNTVDECLDRFLVAIEIYSQNPASSEFSAQYPLVHQIESRADDLRRNIEEELFSKSLLPESRKDLLLLIDAVDHIPNRAEAIIRSIDCQALKLPPVLIDPLQAIAKLAHQNALLVTQAAKHTIESTSMIKDLVTAIDANESRADRIEQQTIRSIFTDPYTDLERILYRDLFLNLGNLLDLTQNVSDHITIFNIKRQI